MSDFVIRPAQSEDIEAIVALWRILQASSAAFEPRLTLRADAAAWFTQYLKAQEENPNMALFVAECEGNVIGYTFGQIMQRPTLEAGDCGYVADLCVREDWRGHGVGRRLYERLRAWFAVHDIRAIEVQVVRANPASQAFWRKMGFHDFLRTLRAEL